jgi:hypothetical protein
MQYSPTPPPTARRQAGAVPHALTAAISKVVRRGPLDSDDELSSAKSALDKLEVTWAGAAGAIHNLGKARRGECSVNESSLTSARSGQPRRWREINQPIHCRERRAPCRGRAQNGSGSGDTGGTGRNSGKSTNRQADH